MLAASLTACSGAAPALTALDLPRGFVDGGAPRRLSGAHFDANARVTFGGEPAGELFFVDARTLEVTTPPHAAGAVDVEVTNPDGQKATLAGAFTYEERHATGGCRSFSQLRPAGCEAARAHFELRLSDVGRASAASVLVAGEFTGWASGALAMAPQGDGLFARDEALSPGAHEYKFVVDGTWLADPHAPTEPIFANSVKTVSDGCLPQVSLAAPEMGAQLPAGLVAFAATATPGQGPDGHPRALSDDGLVFCVDEREVPVQRAGDGSVVARVRVGGGRHRASLQARDAGGFTSRPAWTTFVAQENARPVADAGPTQFVRLGQTVLLDGTGSYDPDGAPLARVGWTQVDGPVTLEAARLPDGRVSSPEGYGNDPAAMPPTTPSRKLFTPSLAGTYTFALEVTGAAGKAARATSVVVVLPAAGPRPRVALALAAPPHGPVTVDVQGATPGAGSRIRWLADPRNPRVVDVAALAPGDGARLTIPRGTLGEGTWRFWTWIEEGNGASWPAGAQLLVRDGRLRVDDALLAPAWARDTNIDEIFVRRFQDSDGDGVGDLNGVTSRLDYLHALGLDTLWLMPIFVSNDHDHGYHTVDYLDVDPDLGTRADLSRLIREAHGRGMRIVLDLALNHTSRQHPFFQRSVQAVRDPAGAGAAASFRDFYVWFDNGSPELLKRYGYGREQGGNRLSLETGWAEIPDIDFGSGQARRYFFDVARFWADPNGDGDFSDGVDGYRLDHVTGPDHVVWSALRTELKAQNPDLLLLAEVFRDFDNGGAGYGIKDYYRGEIDAAFTFPLYWDFVAIWGGHEAPGRLRTTLDAMASDRFPTGALHVAFLENHDVPTGTTAFASWGEEAMKAALTLQVGLPAVPQAVWGEELGSTGYRAFPPWEKEGPQNALEAHFRAVMNLRRDSPVLRRGGLRWLACDTPAVAAFARTLEGAAPLVVVVNTGAARTVACELGDLAADGARLVPKLGGGAPLVVHGSTLTLPVPATSGEIYALSGP